MNESSWLNQILNEEARSADFAIFGAVDIRLAAGKFQKHVDSFSRWLEAGMAGSMSYLARGKERRADPARVLPGAKSVFCVGVPYEPRPLGAEEPARGPRLARYLTGRDYHREIADRLERLMTAVNRRWVESAQPSVRAPLGWKVCVDTSAVLERAWASLAGLGWIGKNTLLIHPKLGSYLFLGLVLLDHETGQGPQSLPDFCGHCQRCLQACPGNALEPGTTLDSRRCVSYWTLENRGEPAAEQLYSFGTWIAGCDICQEVCPFNFRTSRTAAARDPRDFCLTLTWEALLEESPDEYRERVRDCALDRVKPEQFSRNLAIALGNALALDSSGLGGRLFEKIRTRLAGESAGPARAWWEKCLKLAHSDYSPNRKP